jgi:predicted esterase
MATKNISFDFSYTYETAGEINAGTRTIWIVFHGYAQLAKYFIKKFECLVDTTTSVIAPQGLSRFYLSGFSGKTGAAWMTGEARDLDIRNYLTYLDAVYQREIAPYEHHLNIRILGFSQGASTASRWIVHKRLRFERFILWGGFLAHEVDRSKVQKYFSGRNIFLVYGKEDPFVGPEVKKNIERKIKKLGLQPQVVTFEGKHEIHTGTLLQFK